MTDQEAVCYFEVGLWLAREGHNAYRIIGVDRDAGTVTLETEHGDQKLTANHALAECKLLAELKPGPYFPMRTLKVTLD